MKQTDATNKKKQKSIDTIFYKVGESTDSYEFERYLETTGVRFTSRVRACSRISNETSKNVKKNKNLLRSNYHH